MKKTEIQKIKSDWLYFLKTYAVDERDPRRSYSPFEWQEKVFKDIFQREKSGRLKYKVCGISTCRQQGKTLFSIRLAQVYMNLVPDSNVLIINSASEDSATVTVFNRLKKALRDQKAFKGSFTYRKNLIKNTDLNCQAEVLSANKLDVLGRTASLIAFDEAWHLAREKWSLWNDLLPAFATTQGDAQIIAISTAGASDDPEQPMMNLYNHYVNKDMPELYFFYSQDPHLSPLITPESIATQKRLMPSAYFKRNWLNLVGVKGENALEKSEIEGLVSPIPKFDKSNDVVFIGVDLGLKKDLTALAVIGLSGDTYALRYLKYWKPKRELNFDEFEAFVSNLLTDFPAFRYADFDAYQTFRTVQRLKNKFGDRVNAIQFSSSYKKELLKNLIVLIKSGKFKVYDKGDEIDLLKKQLEGLVIDSGWNATHGKDGDDLVIACGIALKRIVEIFPVANNADYIDNMVTEMRSTPNRESVFAEDDPYSSNVFAFPGERVFTLENQKF